MTLDDVTAAVQAYGDQRATDAAAAQKTTDDAATAVLLAGLQGQLLSVQAAYDAYRASHPDVPAPKPEVIEFADFAAQSSGMYLPTASLVGKGSAVTTYRMKPSSSTKASTVAAQGSGKTNPLRLIRVLAGTDVGGFTLAGTEQGHLYGGLNLGPSSGVKVHDVVITGIPGNAAGPPGETFGLDLYRTVDATLTDVTIDGRRDRAGAGVTATGVGYDFAAGTTTATRLVVSYATTGFAVAMWQCTGDQVFNDSSFTASRRLINIEQAIGGSYEFNRCTFGGLAGLPWAAQISTTNKTSAKVTFTDPVCDVWPLKVRTYGPQANNGLNGQQDADICCVIGGKDVTADPTKFQLVHSG